METRDETPAEESGAPGEASAQEVTGDPGGEALREEFARWLLEAHARAVAASPEEAGAEEAEPEEGLPDLWSFYGALAALKEEVRRDARQSRRALEESAQRAQDSEAWLRPELEALRGQVARLAGEAHAEARRRDLLELVGLRDRAALAASAFAAAGRGGLRVRLSGLAPLLASLAQGQEMLLNRFDELLLARGVTVFATRGRPFDPETMKAVEVDPAPGVPEGTVTEELRPGYEWEGRTLRAAEVRVARHANGR
ncbi:MAG: nucleotide exchange factor GrpE [Deltaproteobacteria bacterium]|nr:nucleotide exchange factor GrpE [Deltaproteobacteria bacterium]